MCDPDLCACSENSWYMSLLRPTAPIESLHTPSSYQPLKAGLESKAGPHSFLNTNIVSHFKFSGFESKPAQTNWDRILTYTQVLSALEAGLESKAGPIQP